MVVAGAYQTGIVLMRNLARRGVETYCIDCNRVQPGFKTVYGKAFLCPDPEENRSRWVEWMAGLSRRIGRKPALIFSADQFVSAAAAHAPELQKSFEFAANSAGIYGLLATKRRQYDVAESNGLAIPKTRLVRSHDELQEFAARARFPCLLKPLHFREWERFPPGHPLLNEKVAVAHSADELNQKYAIAQAAAAEVIVQEVVEGPDTSKLVYVSCYGRDGCRLGGCLFRELRTTPIDYGSASAVEPVEDQETERLCDDFFRRIGYRGICELELKRDSRDGRLKLIEANPRYSMTADAAPYAGIDIAWLHYLDLIGHPVSPVKPAGCNFRHIVLRRDFICYRQYLDADLITWGELLRSYRPPVAFFDFDPYDWRVTLDTSVELAKTLLIGPYRKIVGKRRQRTPRSAEASGW